MKGNRKPVSSLGYSVDAPKVCLVIPVYNEADQLEQSTLLVCEMMRASAVGDWEVVIANNGSTDGTTEIAERLAGTLPHVRHKYLSCKGRGRALREVWTESNADILAYMDVDLSTDLSFFAALIEPLTHRAADLSIGSRLLRPQWTTRGMKREVISRCYNKLLYWIFRPSFSDAQCGFKALTKTTAAKLLPMVANNEWFFDTELLLLADRLEYRIFDLPVPWRESLDSRVRILPTVVQDLKGIVRMIGTLKELPARRLNPAGPWNSFKSNNPKKSYSGRSGFTLIELLVTLAVIAVIASLIFPALAGAKAKADSTRCLSNLRQIGVAVRGYATDNSGSLPRAEANSRGTGSGASGASGKAGTPFLEEVLGFQLSGNQVFRCPADQRKNPEVQGSSYEWNTGVNGRLLHRIEDAEQTWLARDLEGWHTEARRNAIFADGHASVQFVQ